MEILKLLSHNILVEEEEIVEKKIADLNTKDREQAAKIIAGSARSIGITVVD